MTKTMRKKAPRAKVQKVSNNKDYTAGNYVIAAVIVAIIVAGFYYS